MSASARHKTPLFFPVLNGMNSYTFFCSQISTGHQPCAKHCQPLTEEGAETPLSHRVAAGVGRRAQDRRAEGGQPGPHLRPGSLPQHHTQPEAGQGSRLTLYRWEGGKRTARAGLSPRVHAAPKAASPGNLLKVQPLGPPRRPQTSEGGAGPGLWA